MKKRGKRKIVLAIVIIVVAVAAFISQIEMNSIRSLTWLDNLSLVTSDRKVTKREVNRRNTEGLGLGVPFRELAAFQDDLLYYEFIFAIDEHNKADGIVIAPRDYLKKEYPTIVCPFQSLSLGLVKNPNDTFFSRSSIDTFLGGAFEEIEGANEFFSLTFWHDEITTPLLIIEGDMHNPDQLREYNECFAKEHVGDSTSIEYYRHSAGINSEKYSYIPLKMFEWFWAN